LVTHLVIFSDSRRASNIITSSNHFRVEIFLACCLAASTFVDNGDEDDKEFEQTLKKKPKIETRPL